MTTPRDRFSSLPDDATLPASSGRKTPATPNSGERRSLPAPGANELWAGKIKVLGELGSGAMAKVLRGYDTKLRREVALKVTRLPRGELPRDELARFAEEAQITAQLEHPNVVPVHDLGTAPDGHAYFSMKLIPGRSLETILERRRENDPATLAQFGLRRLLDVFLQVCQAIDYAHARGVVHRDLKPANIMVGDFGEVQVMDWGIAKLLGPNAAQPATVSTSVEETSIPDVEHPEGNRGSVRPGVTSVRTASKAWQTQYGAVIGTPEYMSPEQARGLPIDGRADIYSLGVILYEILCGQVPFEHDDPHETVKCVISEKPTPPSWIQPSTPAALEALTLRILVKDPAERTLTIPQIRVYVQSYIEGIARQYERNSFVGSIASSAGALVLFAFLVWYLTGQSIAKVLTLGPPAVMNAVGWFLLVLAVGYPLWATGTLFRLGRRPSDPFTPPSTQELFVSGFLAHRTFAAALAPLFQLVFIIELIALASLQATRGALGSSELMRHISSQMRAEWSEALIVILVFQFAYLFLLTAEVRFARRIDRYDLLAARPRWESVWPVFLVVVLLSTVITTEVLDWALGRSNVPLATWLGKELAPPSLDLVEIAKTLVFQGTFLLALSVATMLAAFSFPEILAALRAPNQPADEASVASRGQYFLRSIATFRVARAIWLYGGAMIGSLTAIRMLSESTEHPLLVRILYILGPSLLGFLGYSTLRRRTQRYLAQEPALERMVLRRVEQAHEAQRHANLEELEQASWRARWTQLSAPILGLTGYVIWVWSGMRHGSMRDLPVPLTTKDWLLILPYVLLFPVLLSRDAMQRRFLRRPVGKVSVPAEAQR
ncbi:MAG TPA: serine/threonine-protein kinase [Polyangiaceae bacterium]|nr:serine/threonine-protein kinase [Polyangiaceae bacterium]